MYAFRFRALSELLRDLRELAASVRAYERERRFTEAGQAWSDCCGLAHEIRDYCACESATPARQIVVRATMLETARLLGTH